MKSAYFLLSFLIAASACSTSLLAKRREQKRTQSTKSRVVEITSEEQYDKLLDANKPLVIKFYSDTCGACTTIEGVYKEVSANPDFKGVTFAQIKYDNLPDLCRELGATSLPAIYIIKDEEIVDEMTGAGRAETFKNTLTNKVRARFKIAA
jgi:thioredoxin 1